MQPLLRERARDKSEAHQSSDAAAAKREGEKEREIDQRHISPLMQPLLTEYS